MDEAYAIGYHCIQNFVKRVGVAQKDLIPKGSALPLGLVFRWYYSYTGFIYIDLKGLKLPINKINESVMFTGVEPLLLNSRDTLHHIHARLMF